MMLRCGPLRMLWAVVLIGIAVSLQGCEYDWYRLTCEWHSDMTIKGCSYYTYRSCIQDCEYCVTGSGPDECAQLKCAAYCAKRDDDDCLVHYKQLCQIAVAENFNASAGTFCDVDCSGTSSLRPQQHLLAALVGLVLLLRSVPRRCIALASMLAFVAVALHGCCDDPEPQLNWEPDYGDFKKKADWVDENGIWRGNPTWNFWPELEVEDYVCKEVHPDRKVCVVWTTHESNCGEIDFGICKCHELPDSGDYCQAWGCHSLEADQEICTSDADKEKVCEYNPFPMNEKTYQRLVEQQSAGELTTGESSYAGTFLWWAYDSVWSANGGRLLQGSREDEPNMSAVWESISELTDTNGSAVVRQLDGKGFNWPPYSAYNPQRRHRIYHWDDVCIVNGDNLALALQKCPRWREIETEISQCVCREGAFNGKGCQRWTCEERDVGLFSILYRTKQFIGHLTEGVEKEEYTCKQMHPEYGCTAWEGDIESKEEVEWTRCECNGDCNVKGATWKCDEYELPKTMAWNHEIYIGQLTLFIIAELFLCCGSLFACGEKASVIYMSVCVSALGSLLLLPFLIVTLGTYAWLVLSGPFWIIRMVVCCGACMLEKMAMQRPRSPRERLERGASQIMGKTMVQQTRLA